MNSFHPGRLFPRMPLLLLMILVVTALPAEALTESADSGVIVKSDITSTMYGLSTENPSLSLAVELPLQGSYQLEVSPSLIWGGSTGASYVQASLAVKMRRLYRGFYLGAGAQVAWMRMEGSSDLSGLGAGPLVEAGYRFFPFSSRILLESRIGAGFLAGPRWSSDTSDSPPWAVNPGIYAGISIGYFFE